MDNPVWWVPRTISEKTGNIPQGYIGRTVEEAEASCSVAACELRPDGHDGGCYAWSGTPSLILRRTVARSKPVHQQSLAEAIAKRHRGARYARLGTIGDPAILTRDQVVAIRDTLRDAGLGMLAYTHGWWDRGHHLKGLVMASCDNLEEVDASVSEGWRASVVLDADGPAKVRTPEGRRVVVCPAQRLERVDCNRCGACDASRPGPVIGFRRHGAVAHPRWKRRLAVSRYIHGESSGVIAKELGTTYVSVLAWVRDAGETVRPPGRPRKRA